MCSVKSTPDKFKHYLEHTMSRGNKNRNGKTVTTDFVIHSRYNLDMNSTAFQAIVGLNASGLSVHSDAFNYHAQLYREWKLHALRVRVLWETPEVTNTRGSAAVFILVYKPAGVTYTTTADIESPPCVMFKGPYSTYLDSASIRYPYANVDAHAKMSIAQKDLVWLGANGGWSSTQAAQSELYVDVGDIGIQASVAEGIARSNYLMMEVRFSASFRYLQDHQNLSVPRLLPPIKRLSTPAEITSTPTPSEDGPSLKKDSDIVVTISRS